MRRTGDLIYVVSVTAVLFGFWVLLSGFFTPFLLGAGLGAALAVALITRYMAALDREGHPIHLIARALSYWPWLLWEIVKAAWDVSKLVLHPRLPISPTLIRVKPTQKTAVGVATYANSITLTPGTISVDVGMGEILVHAITRAGAQSLADGDMDRRVTAFEREA